MTFAEANCFVPAQSGLKLRLCCPTSECCFDITSGCFHDLKGLHTSNQSNNKVICSTPATVPSFGVSILNQSITNAKVCQYLCADSGTRTHTLLNFAQASHACVATITPYPRDCQKLRSVSTPDSDLTSSSKLLIPVPDHSASYEVGSRTLYTLTHSDQPCSLRG